MLLRAKYKISEIKDEIANFQGLIDKGLFDKAIGYFRGHLDKPTLYGLETSLMRPKLLQQINAGELSNDEDKLFLLYSLALALNLTGGYPNKAIPLYEQHDMLAEKIGSYKSLSQSLGHRAKALRQVGRFRESEAIAVKGLKIIRGQQDFLREAVNLYWLGMGLAHRGDAINSEIALQRSLRIFRAKFAGQSEGVVHAFLAQRALWLGDYEGALEAAERAFEIGSSLEKNEAHADLHGALKILTAALRMKGEALILQGNFTEGEKNLDAALERAREIEFVEEELPALRALALKELRADSLDKARNYLKHTWHLAERGDFLLYNADSYNILAKIELADNDRKKAIEAARKALKLSICDGPPFAYQRGIEDAQILLGRLGAGMELLPSCDESGPPPISEIEINPDDEFAG